MAKQRLYSIRDQVAAEYGPVMCCKNDAVAIRVALRTLKDVTTPSDFSLWFLGVFDDETGEVLGSAPVSVVFRLDPADA